MSSGDGRPTCRTATPTCAVLLPWWRPPWRCWPPSVHPRSASTTTSSPPRAHPEPLTTHSRLTHSRQGSEASDMTTLERSSPKPEFTDAEAGAKVFPDSTARRYNYYTPQKRKQSHYEDVTVEVQPDPRHYL